MSDLKITSVEAIYLRLPQVKTQCDSGQDALIVKVSTDAGIIGFGEVDSNPMAVKGCIEGPFSHTTATGLAHVLTGEDPFRTEYLWHKMYRANIYGGRRGIGIHAMSGIVTENTAQKIRRMAISAQLRTILSDAARREGLNVVVTSGGQPPAPGRPRTTTTPARGATPSGSTSRTRTGTPARRSNRKLRCADGRPRLGHAAPAIRRHPRDAGAA